MQLIRSILYLGQNCGTSRHRANALRRLGYEVESLDPWDFLPTDKITKRILGKLAHEMSPLFMEPYVRLRLMSRLKGRHFDIIWNNQNELIGAASARFLKQHTRFMVSYINDDPFGQRDKKRFSLFLQGLPFYNLIAVVRQVNVREAYAAGACNVLRIYMSADEVAHQPLLSPREKLGQWQSDVAFVGTWMPERGPFLKRLLELGVPLTIYGDRWNKAPEWPMLKKVWRGPGVSGEEYVKAIQGAKICLGLLSKDNRDSHTTRTAEIPYIGSILCAERTEEHLALYREDEEAVFWDTPKKCAEKCFQLLGSQDLRIRIAKAGRERCITNGMQNEVVTQQIIDALLLLDSQGTRESLRNLADI